MCGNPYDKKRNTNNVRLFTHLNDLFLWYQTKLLTPVGNCCLTKILKSCPMTGKAKQKIM